MAIYITPTDLGSHANDGDVDRVVKSLRAQGFDVYAAPGRTHYGRPSEQRFGVVVALVQAYLEDLNKGGETAVSDAKCV